MPLKSIVSIKFIIFLFKLIFCIVFLFKYLFCTDSPYCLIKYKVMKFCSNYFLLSLQCGENVLLIMQKQYIFMRPHSFPEQMVSFMETFYHLFLEWDVNYLKITWQSYFYEPLNMQNNCLFPIKLFSMLISIKFLFPKYLQSPSN